MRQERTMERKEFYDKADKMLKEAGARLVELKKGAESGGKEVRERYKKEVESLKPRLEEVKKRVKQLRESGDEAWSKLRSSADTSLSELKKSLDKATQRLKDLRK